MNPPCTGQATCGKNFTRSTNCYQVPAGFQFGANWTTDANVVKVDNTYCPDVAGTPTYDAASGAPVTRGSDGKLVVNTTCSPCNYAVGVQSWVQNTCPCFTAGDYCNITPGNSAGVCHLNNNTPCTAAQCPPAVQQLGRRRFHRKYYL